METNNKCDCETLAGMKAHTMECVFGEPQETNSVRATFKEEVRAALDAKIQDHHKEGFIMTAFDEALEAMLKQLEALRGENIESKVETMTGQDVLNAYNGAIDNAIAIIRQHKSHD